MRLLIIGTLEGHMSTAGQIALARGAKVANVNNIDDGLSTLRSGRGADLAMVDIRLPIGDLVYLIAVFQAMSGGVAPLGSSAAASATLAWTRRTASSGSLPTVKRAMISPPDGCEVE